MTKDERVRESARRMFEAIMQASAVSDPIFRHHDSEWFAGMADVLLSAATVFEQRVSAGLSRLALALSEKPAEPSEDTAAFKPRCDAFLRRRVEDGCGSHCTNAVAYVCSCPRCASELPAEKFYACADHGVEAAERHKRVREREAFWVACADAAPARLLRLTEQANAVRMQFLDISHTMPMGKLSPEMIEELEGGRFVAMKASDWERLRGAIAKLGAKE